MTKEVRPCSSSARACWMRSSVSVSTLAVASSSMRRRVGSDSGHFPLRGKWPYGDAPKADNPL